jgi:hypothetical protein
LCGLIATIHRCKKKEGCVNNNNVKEDRKKRDTWELMLLDAINEEFTSKNTKNDNESEDEEDEVFPANDMPGLQQPTHLGSGSNKSEEDDQSDENSSLCSHNANANCAKHSALYLDFLVQTIIKL